MTVVVHQDGTVYEHVGSSVHRPLSNTGKLFRADSFILEMVSTYFY